MSIDVRDIIIEVFRNTAPSDTLKFSTLPLLYMTDGDYQYKEYASLESLELDFPSTTDTYKYADAMFDNGLDTLAVYGKEYIDGTTITDEMVDELFLLVGSHNSWYFLVSDLNTQEFVDKLAETDGFLDNYEKVYFVNTNDLTVATNVSHPRVVVMYHDTDVYAAARWVADGTTLRQGTFNYAKRVLKYATPAVITQGEFDNLIETDYGNTIVQKYGEVVTWIGQCSNHEFIDTITLADLIKYELGGVLFKLTVDEDKIPYTTQGLNLIEGTIISYFNRLINEGSVDRIDVKMPTMQEITPEMKANRELTGIQVDVYITGAINVIKADVYLEL